jgi:thioredoxin-related protein
MKTFILFLVFFWAIPQSFAQLIVRNFEEIDSLQKVEKRNVIVFIHTDWCQFCQAMKNTTFKNDAIIKELNNAFYFVDFNAEEKRTIVFNNHTFKFNPSGNNAGIQDLAIALGTINKQISYPIVCILNDKNEIIFQNNSFINAKDFKIILERLKTKIAIETNCVLRKG